MACKAIFALMSIVLVLSMTNIIATMNYAWAETPSGETEQAALLEDDSDGIIAATSVDASADQIDDDATPLAQIELVPGCWVHWLMILGILVSIGYGAGVVIVRRRETEELEEMENRALGRNITVSAANQVSTQNP